MKYIYCHPLFDERKCAHRFSFKLSQIFKQNELYLTIFDYRGTGDADGDFSSVTMKTMQKDLNCQINNRNTCLIGTRFGASLAFDFCCRGPMSPENLILPGGCFTSLLSKNEIK